MAGRVTLAPITILLALAGCSREAAEQVKPVDPAISAPLAGPQLT